MENNDQKICPKCQISKSKSSFYKIKPDVYTTVFVDCFECRKEFVQNRFKSKDLTNNK